MNIKTSAKTNNGSWTYSESLSMKSMIWILFPVFIAINIISAVSTAAELSQPVTWNSIMANYQRLWLVQPWEIAIPILICLLVAALLLSIRLRWSLTPSEFRFSYFPFVWKEKIYSMEEIDYIQVLKINPLLEFGGWGLRRGRLGKAYTTSGKYILHVKLLNGKGLNVSVLRPTSASEFLSTHAAVKFKP